MDIEALSDGLFAHTEFFVAVGTGLSEFLKFSDDVRFGGT